QLRNIDNSQVAFLPVDPTAGWSNTSFTSIPVNNFPLGPALVTVFTNGIPSDSKYVVVSLYTISVSASPSAGGTVSGGGGYASGSSVTVTATPNSGFGFVSWTENQSVVSTSSSYTFTAGANRTLTANFAPIIQVTVKTSISGPTFTVDGSTYASAQTFSWTSASSH